MGDKLILGEVVDKYTGKVLKRGTIGWYGGTGGKELLFFWVPMSKVMHLHIRDKKD